jgi:hypothetical protein
MTMDTPNKNLLSLMDGLIAAAKSGGMLQQLLEVPEIRDLLFEFRQSAQRAAQFAEYRPPVVGPEDRRETGGQDALPLALPSSTVRLLSPRQCEIL